MRCLISAYSGRLFGIQYVPYHVIVFVPERTAEAVLTVTERFASGTVNSFIRVRANGQFPMVTCGITVVTDIMEVSPY